MISGSLVNGIWNVHGFDGITFDSRLKKMAAMKNFSMLFYWTQGKYFVIFAVMQDKARALMNYFESPIYSCGVRYVENLKSSFV